MCAPWIFVNGHFCSIRDTEMCVLPYVRETSRSLRWQCIVEPPPSRPEEERKTQSRQRSLSSRPRLKAHTRGHPCRECWWQAGQAAGPTRSWSMPSTRGFPARAHPRATPQTGRSGFRAASRDDVLPLIRPKLVCACLPFSSDHVSLPREQTGGGDSVTMSLQPSWAPTCACAAHRVRDECEGET